MGTPFANMGLGSFPSVKDTQATRSYLNAIADYWLGECPIPRSTTYYIGHDPAGDSTGGGGAGTVSDPYLCNTSNDMAALIASLWGTGDVRVRLRGGDTFRGTLGVTMDVANCTLDTYGTGKATISAFNQGIPIGSRWQPGSGNSFRYTDAASLGYLRRRDEPLNPYVEAESNTEVGSIVHSFHWDGSNTVHVNIDGSSDPSDFEWEYTHRVQDSGIEVTADGCRVDNIITEGWACIVNDNDIQQYGIRVTLSGTDGAVISNSEDYYTGRHCCSFNNNNGAGGLCLFEKCRGGYSLHTIGGGPPLGGANIFNSYAESGGQEVIYRNPEVRFGVLPSVLLGSSAGGGADSQASIIYSHTVSAAFKCSLFGIMDAVFSAETDKSHATWGEGLAYCDDSNAPDASEATPDAFRSIIIGTRANHGQPCAGSMDLRANNAWIDCIQAVELTRSGNFLNGARPLAGYAINCVYNWNSALINQFILTSDLVGNNGVFDQCYLRIDAPFGGTLIWRFLATGADRNLVFRDCVFSSPGGKDLTPTNTNDAAHFVHCAWVPADVNETGPDGCDADLGAVQLASDVDPGPILDTSPLYNTGSGASGISHDITGTPRITSDIGPFTITRTFDDRQLIDPGVLAAIGILDN